MFVFCVAEVASGGTSRDISRWMAAEKHDVSIHDGVENLYASQEGSSRMAVDKEDVTMHIHVFHTLPVKRQFCLSTRWAVRARTAPENAE